MTFAELLLSIGSGYLIYRLLGPLQRRLEHQILRFLRRGRPGVRPVIDITSRKDR